MGTHPIFESDFDCLTGKMQEIQKKKTSSNNRWNIETARCRETLPAPVGYSSHRAVIDANQDKQQGPDQFLLDKRNWEMATKQFKSLPMQLFMFYMIGDSINLMPILMLGGSLWSTVSSVVKVGVVAEQLKRNSPQGYPLQLLTWIVSQAAMCGLLIWKFNRMGLLPTHESDWLAFREPLVQKNFVQGGDTM